MSTSNPIIVGLLVSLLAVGLYHFYQKKANDEEEVNYNFYVKIFVLVFIISFMGVYLLGSSASVDDGFLNQKYEKNCPELIPRKRFQKSKTMKLPSVSVDSLKLLSPVSIKV